jgi:hypothetical protein
VRKFAVLHGNLDSVRWNCYWACVVCRCFGKNVKLWWMAASFRHAVPVWCLAASVTASLLSCLLFLFVPGCQLYDLMTMGFKNQLINASTPTHLLQITLNHLDALSAAISNTEVLEMIQRTHKMTVAVLASRCVVLPHPPCPTSLFVGDRRTPR